MGFIENADGQQHQTAARDQVVAQVELDIRLLQLDFAIGAVAGQGVLQLQFGDEADLVTEGVADEQDKAVEIHFLEVVGAVVGAQIVVVQFSITAPVHFLA